MTDREVLAGGHTHQGGVVRIGDTVRRPRTDGAELVEAFLLHLEAVGFDGAPRFLGVDDDGRHVLSFVDGEVASEPPWLRDEEANLTHLADVARLLRRVHDAGVTFVPPTGATPRRPCPAPGDAWIHADAHYGNVVFRGDEPVALIDWDFTSRGDPVYDVVTLLFCCRQPRPDRPDEWEDRERSARRALAMFLDAYGADDDERARATRVAAVMCDGAADYLEAQRSEIAGADPVEIADEVARRRAVAAWWRAET